MARDHIFISYSHKDRRWLEELKTVLAPLVRKRKLELWDDTRIRVGKKWKNEIQAALAEAKLAILLVSRHFLSSEFIAENEFPALLEAAQEKGLTIIWIAVGDSLYEETEITEFQAANDPSRPLNSLAEADLDRELVNISRQIGLLANLNEELELEDASSKGAAEQTVAEAEMQIRDLETNALARMRQALADGKWAWRSVDRLTVKGGLSSEQEALQLLRSDPEIVLSRGRSGRRIARLKSRTP